MPQLDQLTFLSQYFWLCIFFISFYILLLKYFLPQMSCILKLRERKTNMSQDGLSVIQQENLDVSIKYDQLLINALKKSRNFFADSLSTTSNWLSKIVTNTNKTKLKKMNKNYLLSLGLMNLSKNTTLSNFNTVTLSNSNKTKSCGLLLNKKSKVLLKDNFISQIFRKIRGLSILNKKPTKIVRT